MYAIYYTGIMGNKRLFDVAESKIKAVKVINDYVKNHFVEERPTVSWFGNTCIVTRSNNWVVKFEMVENGSMTAPFEKIDFDTVFEKTISYSKLHHQDVDDGKDWFYILRVQSNARRIQNTLPESNPDLVHLIVLLHEIESHSISKHGYKRLFDWLNSLHFSIDENRRVREMIDQVHRPLSESVPTIEATIVRDAVHLDLIGAIGIARCFAEFGKQGHPIYKPQDMNLLNNPPKPSAISAFYGKLLHIKDALHTQEAKNLAEQRDQFIGIFLNQFFLEFNNEI